MLWRRRRDMASMRGPQMAEPTQSMGEWDVRVFALVAQSVYLCVFRRRAGVELACLTCLRGMALCYMGTVPHCVVLDCGLWAQSRIMAVWSCAQVIVELELRYKTSGSYCGLLSLRHIRGVIYRN